MPMSVPTPLVEPIKLFPDENVINFFKQCSKFTPEEIEKRQLALDETEDGENEELLIVTDEGFSNIVQKCISAQQEQPSNVTASNESEQSVLKIFNEITRSVELCKSSLLNNTKAHFDYFFPEHPLNKYPTIKSIKEIFEKQQLEKIFQNIRTLTNKLNTAIENDFASKVFATQKNASTAIPAEDSTHNSFPAEGSLRLLKQIKSYENYALGKKDIEKINPNRPPPNMCVQCVLQTAAVTALALVGFLAMDFWSTAVYKELGI